MYEVDGMLPAAVVAVVVPLTFSWLLASVVGLAVLAVVLIRYWPERGR